MRQLRTLLGFAIMSSGATLAIAWPGRTYADPPETFYGAGVVDDVSFEGEIVRDASAKNGWAIMVTYSNGGEADETCTIQAQLTRQTVNPASRSGPAGVAVWRHKEKVTVAAHESVVRSYDVPAWVAVQLTANDKATDLRQKAIDRDTEKPTPSYAVSMRPYTMYSVAFQKLDG
jgi:hypothetical protein